MIDNKDMLHNTHEENISTLQIDKKQEEIADVLKDNEFIVDETEAEILTRLKANQEKLPWHLILEKLKNSSTISCEIHRKQKIREGWWNKTVWPALAFEDVWLGEILSTQKEKVQGNIMVYLVVQKIKTVPLTLQVSAKIVEYPDPSKGDMISRWIVFQNKLSGPEFEKENIILK